MAQHGCNQLHCIQSPEANILWYWSSWRKCPHQQKVLSQQAYYSLFDLLVKHKALTFQSKATMPLDDVNVVSPSQASVGTLTISVKKWLKVCRSSQAQKLTLYFFTGKSKYIIGYAGTQCSITVIITLQPEVYNLSHQQPKIGYLQLCIWPYKRAILLGKNPMLILFCFLKQTCIVPNRPKAVAKQGHIMNSLPSWSYGQWPWIVSMITALLSSKVGYYILQDNLENPKSFKKSF